MSEVKIDSLYKVTITEYERGWGQRTDPSDTKFFTTLEEAKKYAHLWEQGGTSDFFFRAEISKQR